MCVLASRARDQEERTERRLRSCGSPQNEHCISGKNIEKKNIFPKITEIQLLAIREKMKKQNRQERDIFIVSFVIAIPITIILIVGFLKVAL